MSRRRWLGIAGTGVLALAGIAFFRRDRGADQPGGVRAVMYASIECRCCRRWARYLRGDGFEVEVIVLTDMDARKAALGVPVALHSCHTAEIDGYVVEGHVPAEIIRRFLAERPPDRGLAVPGMPGGSPGMENEPKVVFDVLAFAADGSTRVYATT